MSQRLWRLDEGVLLVYGRLSDLWLHPPSGRVTSVILDTHESPANVGRAVEWLRRHWGQCPITVVGDAGGGEQELIARSSGAAYLTRPVSEEQWLSVVGHVVLGRGRVGSGVAPLGRNVSRTGR